MFGGLSIQVKLRVPENVMNEMTDWFGKDFGFRRTEHDGVIEIWVNYNKQAMFYWALQYGSYVEVVEPKGLRDKIASAVQNMC